MTSIFVLPEQLQANTEKLARRGYPRESCGLFLGQGSGNGRHVVLHQHPGHNIASSHHRYEIDAEEDVFHG